SGGFIYARNGVVDVGKEQIRIGRTDNDIRYHSISSYHTVNAAANYLKFKVHDGAASAPYTLQTTVMIMLGNGNVGIGTETPSEKLDVDGDVSVTGTVNGRDVSADGDKLDTITDGIDSDIVAKKIAKRIDITTINSEVTLFTIPSGRYAMLDRFLLTAFANSSASTGSNDGVIDITYNNRIGQSRTLSVALNTMSTTPFYNEIIPNDTTIGSGAVTIKVTTTGTGTIVIKGEVTW
nr:hypothetical protein [Prolixibacteraceae bacterium]